MAIRIVKKKQAETVGKIPTKEQFALAMITREHMISVLTKERGKRFSINKKVEVHVIEMQREDGSVETWNWKGSINGKKYHGFLRSGKYLLITFDEQ